MSSELPKLDFSISPSIAQFQTPKDRNGWLPLLHAPKNQQLPAAYCSQSQSCWPSHDRIQMLNLSQICYNFLKTTPRLGEGSVEGEDCGKKSRSWMLKEFRRSENCRQSWELQDVFDASFLTMIFNDGQAMIVGGRRARNDCSLNLWKVTVTVETHMERTSHDASCDTHPN